MARTTQPPALRSLVSGLVLGLFLGGVLGGDAHAQRRVTAPTPQDTAKKGAGESQPEMIHMDFKDADLSVVIAMIALKTGKNFIYDDKVRGKITIVSPTPVTLEEAYAVFESVLKVKGFTVITASRKHIL